MCVQRVLVYGSETWPIRVEELRRLERTERMMIRWMCGVTLKDRCKSEELRKRLEIEVLQIEIGRQLLAVELGRLGEHASLLLDGPLAPTGLGGFVATAGTLRASANQRDNVGCPIPVSRPSFVALTAFFPVSRWTIFCLKATENGLVTLSCLVLAPHGFKFERRDNYPDTGGNERRGRLNRSPRSYDQQLTLYNASSTCSRAIGCGYTKQGLPRTKQGLPCTKQGLPDHMNHLPRSRW